MKEDKEQLWNKGLQPTVFYVSKQIWDMLLEYYENPPKDTEAFKKAEDRYKKEILKE